MALEIIWSKSATKGYGEILRYLDNNWTEKEVENFELGIKDFFIKLSTQPYLLQQSNQKGIRKGPINKLTIITYRVSKIKAQIQVLTMRSAREKPLSFLP